MKGALPQKNSIQHLGSKIRHKKKTQMVQDSTMSLKLFLFPWQNVMLPISATGTYNILKEIKYLSVMFVSLKNQFSIIVIVKYFTSSTGYILNSSTDKDIICTT